MSAFFNPAVAQALGLMFLVGGLLFVGGALIRGMRKQFVGAEGIVSPTPRVDTTSFATAAYQGVIGDLKQREKQLQAQLSEESRRYKELDSLHKIVLESIGTGVLTFTPNLVVVGANPAAKRLLGYASPFNLQARELFTGLEQVELPSSNGALGGITQALKDVFTSGAEYRGIPATLRTPAGDCRELKLALLPIRDAARHVMAVACFMEVSTAEVTLSVPESDQTRTQAE
jgi:PAS domain-containing protein